VIAAVITAGLLAAGLHLHQRSERIAARLPAIPELARRPAELVDRIANADRAARSLFRPAPGLATLARLYQANGFADEAIACLELLLELEPSDPRWPHLLATLLAGYGRLDEARAHWQNTLRLAPDYLPARLRLGDAALKSNQLEESAASYRAVLAGDPHNPYALLGLARIDLARQEPEAARAHLEAAVSARPDLAGAWALLATVHDRAGETLAAKAARQRASADRHREPPDAWVDALADDNYDPYQIAIAAEIAAEAGRLDEARRGFERAVILDPANAISRRLLGKFHAERGESAAARAELERAVSLDPTNADGWLFLLQTCEALADRAASARALADGLRHCPSSSGLHHENGRRLAAQQRYPAAIAAFQEAKRLRPQEAAPYIDLAIVYLRTGQTDRGIAELQAAHEAEPGHPMPLISLARHAIDTGDETAARNYLRQLRLLGSAQAADVAALTEHHRNRFGHDPR